MLVCLHNAESSFADASGRRKQVLLPDVEPCMLQYQPITQDVSTSGKWIMGNPLSQWFWLLLHRSKVRSVTIYLPYVVEG